MATPFLDARTVCAALSTSPAVVHFVKLDGSTRRMLSVPTPGGTRERIGRDGSRLVAVWDAERGAIRHVNASRTTSIRPLRARQHPSTAEPYGKTAAEHVRDIFGE